MKLFPEDSTINILPFNGEVYYYGSILNFERANFYYQKLVDTIAWENDIVEMYGKRIITKRKVAWYGDEKYPYRYSGTTKHALLWTTELLTLKKEVEKQTGEKFNSCLLNLYHDGEEKMAWHSDNEKALLKNGAIASFSFGAERKFSFKHKKDKNTISLILEHGSLLVMKGSTQSHWLHQLPANKKVKIPRINLTFRTIIE